MELLAAIRRPSGKRPSERGKRPGALGKRKDKLKWQDIKN
jgi:hypothetical protein